MDIESAYECASEWLPDFIAYAENPNHVDAPNLAARATSRIRESYRETYENDPDAEGWIVAAEVLIIFCFGVADWIVADRAARLEHTP